MGRGQTDKQTHTHTMLWRVFQAGVKSPDGFECMTCFSTRRKYCIIRRVTAKTGKVTITIKSLDEVKKERVAGRVSRAGPRRAAASRRVGCLL